MCLLEHTHEKYIKHVSFVVVTHMTLSFENLSTREPSPFADTLTAALLAFCDLLTVPVNLAGRAGANVAAKEAILRVWYVSAQDAGKVPVLLIGIASWLSVAFPRHLLLLQLQISQRDFPGFSTANSDQTWR